MFESTHLLLDFEHAVERFRRSLHNHPIRIALMENLDELVAKGKQLIDLRAAADAKAATESARADKAEADLSAANAKVAELEQQIAADDQKAAAAAAEIQAEIDRETPAATVTGGGADTITGEDSIHGALGNDSIVSGDVVHV